MELETFSYDKLAIALDIVNSNPDYNLLEHGRETRTPEEVIEEFDNKKTVSLLIKDEHTYVGIMDYIMENPHDGTPWLGLLMIHQKYKRNGYGKKAYLAYEKEMIKKQVKKIRIGVIRENHCAKDFWEHLGFQYYISKNKDGLVIDCYEKRLSKDKSILC